MDLRTETLIFLGKFGSTKTWLAKQLRCSVQHLIYYLNGERNLSEEKSDILREIIRRKGNA